jgi:hypothetical protein
LLSDFCPQGTVVCANDSSKEYYGFNDGVPQLDTEELLQASASLVHIISACGWELTGIATVQEQLSLTSRDQGSGTSAV